MILLKLCTIIKKKADIKLICISLLVFLPMLLVMRQGAAHLAKLTNSTGILDLSFGYSLDKAYTLFERQGITGRAFYLHTFYIIDLFYPITYMMFYTLTLAYLLKITAVKNMKVNYLILLPIIGMIFDWLENIAISLMLLAYPAPLSALCKFSSILTISKFIFVYTGVFISIILLLTLLPATYMKNLKKKVLLYPIDHTAKITKNQNILYKKTTKKDLLMDVYRPTIIPSEKKLPVVILVHGDGPEFYLKDVKSWGLYESYGKLLASLGYVAVVFNHRAAVPHFKKLPEITKDIVDAVNYVKTHASDYQIDAQKICVWTFSMGALHNSTFIMDLEIKINCLVSYYGLLDLGYITKKKYDNCEPYYAKNYIPKEERCNLPILIVKAAKDSKKINGSIEHFREVADNRHLVYQLITHATGKHAFDALDDNEETRSVINQTLAFIKQTLNN